MHLADVAVPAHPQWAAYVGGVLAAVGALPPPFTTDLSSIHCGERNYTVKNRMRELRSSGSVRGGDGNVSTYSALGVDEAGDGLGQTVVDEVAVCDSYATETAQRLPHHCARAGGRTGEGALVRVTVEGPAIAGV